MLVGKAWISLRCFGGFLNGLLEDDFGGVISGRVEFLTFRGERGANTGELGFGLRFGVLAFTVDAASDWMDDFSVFGGILGTYSP